MVDGLQSRKYYRLPIQRDRQRLEKASDKDREGIRVELGYRAFLPLDPMRQICTLSLAGWLMLAALFSTPIVNF